MKWKVGDKIECINDVSRWDLYITKGKVYTITKTEPSWFWVLSDDGKTRIYGFSRFRNLRREQKLKILKCK